MHSSYPTFSGLQSLATPSSSPQDIHLNVSRSIHRSLAGFLMSTSPHNPHVDQSTLGSSWSCIASSCAYSTEASLDGMSSPSSASSRHLHGCHVCQEHGPFKTCDGWKRHMKEHETSYPCPRCGSFEGTERARSYTRSSALVNHLLESHGEPRGSSVFRPDSTQPNEPSQDQDYLLGIGRWHIGSGSDLGNAPPTAFAREPVEYHDTQMDYPEPADTDISNLNAT